MVDLENQLGKEFYEGIIKLDFLSDLKDIMNENGLISIDLPDLKAISSNELVGVISKESNDFEEAIEIKKLIDKKPTDCIVKISSELDIKLSDIDKIIKNIKVFNNDMNIIYGYEPTNNLLSKYKLQAIFTYNDKSHNSLNKKEDELESNKDSNSSLDEKELLYEIALHIKKEQTVSINSIQTEFCLGFNKASSFIAKLEKLGIISARYKGEERKLLINDEKKIKEVIYNDNEKEVININKYISYDEKDLMYEIALHIVNGCPISINCIQNDFAIGFNRTFRMFEKLEELGIISKRDGIKPRRLLINDTEKIKELIMLHS